MPLKRLSRMQFLFALAYNRLPRQDPPRLLLSRVNWSSHALYIFHLMTHHDFLDALLSDFCHPSRYAYPIGQVFGWSPPNGIWQHR